jgi:hypothetical protein
MSRAPPASAGRGTQRLLGLRGWQWVFIVTGIPAVVIGFITLVYLDDRPDPNISKHP